MFILIALFSHFEEDVHKRNWLWYSTVDFSQEKVNGLIKKKEEAFLDLYGKKKKGAIFNKLQHNSSSDTMLNQLSVIEP